MTKKNRKKGKLDMKVTELTRNELLELKQWYYTDTSEKEPSYEELVNINEIISDEEIFLEYKAYDFVSDDFFCNQ